MKRYEMIDKLITAIRLMDAEARNLVSDGNTFFAKKVHVAACGLQEVAEALLRGNGGRE